MLFRYTVTALAVLASAVAQDLTFDSAAFNGSSSNIILYANPASIYTTNIDVEAPTLLINTYNVSGSFIVVMAYNYTATTTHGSFAAQNETVTRWAWIQTDMTIAWASDYPDNQLLTGATLVNTTSPVIPYTAPQFDTPSTTFTLQIWEETQELKNFLPSVDHTDPASLARYLDKMYAFLNYESAVANSAGMMAVPRAGVEFVVGNYTGDPSAELPLIPTEISIQEAVTTSNGTTATSGASVRSSNSRLAALSSIAASLAFFFVL